MIEAIDTFEEHFRTNVLAFNASRKVIGVLDARDWPPATIDQEAFYLLSLGEAPVAEAQSAAMPVYTHTVQITWIIAGADLLSSNRGLNRGNRYRVNMQMKAEVLRGLFPYFAEKKSYSINQANGSLVITPIVPQEFIIWSKAQFGPSQPAKDSGVIYGIATVYVANMTDKIPG